MPYLNAIFDFLGLSLVRQSLVFWYPDSRKAETQDDDEENGEKQRAGTAVKPG